jgi:glycosyltransferase involved in cell wall biosynthesis
MKILTNIQTSQVAGITQTLSSFINFVSSDKKNKTNIVGVDILPNHSGEPAIVKKTEGAYSLISAYLNTPHIIETIKKADSIETLKGIYTPVIETYALLIKSEQPDLILINGTYYMPWCLLQAAQMLGVPTVLHYHGSLTKETEHWQGKARELFKAMEKDFDADNLAYVFPSSLAKDVVEKEVFGHAIKKFTVLPNPVPLHFFEAKPKRGKKHVGIVGRWTRIKNTKFSKMLARYNLSKGGELKLHVVSDLKRNSPDRNDFGSMMHFRNPMSPEKLSSFYSQMGVILSPSFFETYGNVAKEAVASGTPALVSSNMGVAETFSSLGLKDWIIDFNSPKAVYDRIKEMNGERVPEHIRDEMKEHFSPKVIHAKLLTICKSM